MCPHQASLWTSAIEQFGCLQKPGLDLEGVVQDHPATVQAITTLLNSQPHLRSLHLSRCELSAAAAAGVVSGLAHSALSCMTSLSITHMRSVFEEDCGGRWLSVLLDRRIDLQASSGAVAPAVADLLHVAELMM